MVTCMGVGEKEKSGEEKRRKVVRALNEGLPIVCYVIFMKIGEQKR